MSPSGHLNSGRLRMAMVGTRKENVPPWMIGSRQPKVLCNSVTRPETKKMVEMIKPLAGSSSLTQSRGQRMKGMETVEPNIVR